MRSFLSILLLTIVLASVRAEEPSWAVKDAADKLLAKHALQLPASDLYARRDDGSYARYSVPVKTYEKNKGEWIVSYLSEKERICEKRTWGPWRYPEKGAKYWLLAKIRVSANTTGGTTAEFIDIGAFKYAKSPTASEVTQLPQ